MSTTTAKKIHDLYEKDAFKWYFENAKLLRERKFDLIDIDNLVEEVESMGRSERKVLDSYFIVLFLHLLKLKYQPNYADGIRSWKLSVKEQRKRIKRHLKENPSLKGYFTVITKNAYEDARLEAARETGMDEEIFPKKNPFTIEEALKEDWYP